MVNLFRAVNCYYEISILCQENSSAGELWEFRLILIRYFEDLEESEIKKSIPDHLYFSNYSSQGAAVGFAKLHF